ncbi:MAG: GNAT family N-acetyltransferase [Eubacterium sp.]|nr:GNAT family N-acetyltransferase [Eubacterium sp.]
MKDGLLVLFPGIRYSVDSPLLYYTRVAYSYAGYEVIAIDDYGVKSGDDLGAYADQAVKTLTKRLKDVSFEEYAHVVFAEKSVGTVIGPMLEDAMGLKNVFHIVYTPLEAIYSYLKPERRILGIAAGTTDKHIEIKALRAACKKLEIPLVEIKNGGHRLEAGKDVTKDISAVAQVIATIGDPKEITKLEKKLADKKAAEEKAAAEKKAAEEKVAAEKKAAEEKAAAEKKAAEKKATEKNNGSSKADIKNIRKLKQGTKTAEKQIEEMMEIWLQSNVKEQSFVPKKYWSKNYKEVLRVMGLASVYYYEEDGKILGFAGSMEEAMVAISVAEGQRDRGIGSLLLNKLQDEMGVLEVIVYSKNKKAQNFFSKNDFKAKDIQIEEATGEETIFLTW